ncbi:hypothetical protein PRIPAC_80861 [Pristionchus pacificus]|uniref:G protein-coupled receptor n=1 Tax=Pristionchus pacificus TaxID=54126 RepID=A0A8R1UXC6_PRIPA|nr:hypothetical protein PRIPAC_80861 [Pristionchus pacificus]|eukprot:PDM80012.1 hypothetical protein PRIPAC_32591 [Pristionchus pacificus]
MTNTIVFTARNRSEPAAGASHTERDAHENRIVQIIFVVNDIAYSSYSFITQEVYFIFNSKIMHAFEENDHERAHIHAFPNELIRRQPPSRVYLLLSVLANFSHYIIQLSLPLLGCCLSRPHPTPLHRMVFTLSRARCFAWYCNSYFMYAASDEERAELVPNSRTNMASTRALAFNVQRDSHYNAQPLIGLAVFCGILSAAFAFMGGEFTISAKTRKLQYSLFRILTVQV